MFFRHPRKNETVWKLYRVSLRAIKILKVVDCECSGFNFFCLMKALQFDSLGNQNVLCTRNKGRYLIDFLYSMGLLAFPL